jgi:2-polyprenyl-3-methyl-5-hydroxy-6-metoxy-1,4-benzoquinol methylase
MPTEHVDQWKHVDAAFSKQSVHFDEDDLSNPVLQEWRIRIYAHVDRFIKPNSKILELNAGTGIDAVRFAKLGHQVHATDISEGMIKRLLEKNSIQSLSDKITVQHKSYEQLDQVNGKFDYVFSNFGGLNCIDDLTKVTKHLPNLLNEGALVTWVIMPRISPWEWTWILKGKFGEAFRRFKRSGVMANLEGQTFLTYYYPLNEIIKSFHPQFQLIKSEGLGIFSPPPSAEKFTKRFTKISNFLEKYDRSVSKFPLFNKWGDHIITTFKYNGQ